MDALHVHESGTPGAPAVVFLQGTAVSGRMWRGHMACLDQHHCLAPDLPGFGRSNRIPWRSVEDTAERVAHLIETRVPARRAHVVGLSLGGCVAHVLLARHAELLDRVVIDGAGALPWRGSVPFGIGLAAVAPFLHTPLVLAALSRAVGGLSESDLDDIRIASPSAFRRSWSQANATRISVSEISAPCPTLLVAGERETTVRPSNAALAALMPNATARYVPGVGHGWLGARPDLHVAMVCAWVNGDDLPALLLPETIGWPRETVDRVLRRSA